jgi:hypothetical protein
MPLLLLDLRFFIAILPAFWTYIIAETEILKINIVVINQITVTL